VPYISLEEIIYKHLCVIINMEKTKVLLDTNFILTCVKQKIDFFEYLEMHGIQILIPEQVIDEIKKMIVSKKKMHFKDDAKLSIIVLKKYNTKFKKIDLNWKNVDNAIMNYAKENPDIIIATLDKEIKTKLKNKKLIIQGKNRLEIR
jgi:hypothetical protein